MLNSKRKRLEEIEVLNNPIDEKTTNYIFSVIYPNSLNKINLDIFEVLHVYFYDNFQYLNQERLERTVWISPLSYATFKNSILNALSVSENLSIQIDNSKLGIPLSIRMIRPKKLGEKKDNNTCDAFIEFIHPNSANRMLKIAATSGFSVSGKKMRVYKAGTRPEKLSGKGSGKKKQALL